MDACDIVFINLGLRPDRKKQIEAELKKLGIANPRRLNATQAEPGILGANISHARALLSSSRLHELIMVCEDDAEFLIDRSRLEHYIEEFRKDKSLDVLCLSYSTQGRFLETDGDFRISNNVQTAACYLLRSEHIDRVAECFLQGARKLEKGGRNWIFALDIFWKSLQRWTLIFAIPRDLPVVQRPSWSDIENTFVKYF